MAWHLPGQNQPRKRKVAACLNCYIKERGLSCGRYCSETCRVAHKEKRELEALRIPGNKSVSPDNPNLYINHITVGAVQELKICIDLMMRGFQVLRNQSPSGTDLCIVFRKKAIRVEVKTAHRDKRGEIKATIKPDDDKFDLLACVTPHGNVVYFPPIETLFGPCPLIPWPPQKQAPIKEKKEPRKHWINSLPPPSPEDYAKLKALLERPRHLWEKPITVGLRSPWESKSKKVSSPMTSKGLEALFE